ncbi:HpcH/HpaI aldolase/citrate lyase family protein [Microbacterium sp. NPDC078428]|uniref:HpcH/HpaI aldolase/citrate lyase family protein n=1 Tax=Microbacterium sp. NPDC078428 TaxID=3364190 RepID=UPI0037C7A632
MTTSYKTRVGAWISIASAFAAEQIAREGFDYVCVDGQHGLLDYGELRDALIGITAAAGPTPFARVSTNSAAEIGRMLDAGAQGIIVPLVNSVEEAEEAAAAVRYPVSGGRRSYGPFRLGTHFAETPAQTDDGVTLLVMIETASALEQVERIVAVEGIDGVYVGPYDLSLALGAKVPFEPEILPRLEEAIERVRRAASAAGKLAGIHCVDGDMAQAKAAQGFDLVTAVTDIAALRSECSRQLSLAKNQVQERSSGY